MAPLRKCLVWDLDNTLWDGVLLETEVEVRPEARRVIATLDGRGILHSIASRGDESTALAVLRANGLADYFLAPQINWEPKPRNILAVCSALRLSLDAMAFVDDDPFELAQVEHMLPEVLPLPAGEIAQLPDHPCFRTDQLSAEARSRRGLYMAEQRRQAAQGASTDRMAFLRSCSMQLTVRPLARGDLARVLELVSRTHQLNTAGRPLDEDQLTEMLNEPSRRFRVTVAELTDRFGGYGTIGVAVVEIGDDCWRLHLLAVSCRVLGRGVERALLSALLERAAKERCLRAEGLFRNTGRNRPMLALYQMMGFRRCGSWSPDGTAVLARSLDETPPGPPWIRVLCESS